MCLIAEHAHLKKRCAELESRLAELGEIPLTMPPAPAGGPVITGTELNALLAPYGIILSGGSGDFNYKLMTKAEGQVFLDWYRDLHPYTDDDYDCEDFAWCMRAAALKWMHGEYAWGYIEAEGLGEITCNFPNHGFCFLVFEDKTVWYCDELALAAPEDEFYEAYRIKCNMAKA